MVQPKEGWCGKVLGFNALRPRVDVPLVKVVMIIGSRPAERQYGSSQIRSAVNIPDSQFDKMADKLPAEKAG